MTRLTTVGHVPPPQRQDAERQPARDFAQMLARDGAALDQGRAPAKISVPAPAATTISAPTFASASVAVEAANPARIPDAAVTGPSIPGRMSVDETPKTVGQELLLATANPVGMTEALQYARVFGVHLLPGSYLSEVVVRDAPDEGTTPAMMRSVPEGDAPVSALSPCVDSLAESVTGWSRQSLVPDVAVAMSEVVSEAAWSPADEAMPASAVAPSYAALAAVWSERALHVTGAGAGRAVAWIRDYRLDRHDEEKLVQAVLQEARTQGVALGKIIVNGREAWASHEAI